MIKVNKEHILRDVDMKAFEDKIAHVHGLIENRNGPGADYLGWARYPETYDKEEFERIIKAAKEIRAALETCGSLEGLYHSHHLLLRREELFDAKMEGREHYIAAVDALLAETTR